MKLKAHTLLVAGAALLPLTLTVPVAAQALTPPEEQFTMHDSRADGRMAPRFDRRAYSRDHDRADSDMRYSDSDMRYSSREMNERAITDDLNEQSLEDARG